MKAMESRRRAVLKAARVLIAHVEQADETYYAIRCDLLDELEAALHVLDTELRRRQRKARAAAK